MRIKSFICNPLKKRLLDFGWRLDDQHKMLIFGVASWLLIRIPVKIFPNPKRHVADMILFRNLSPHPSVSPSPRLSPHVAGCLSGFPPRSVRLASLPRGPAGCRAASGEIRSPPPPGRRPSAGQHRAAGGSEKTTARWVVFSTWI